MGSGQGPLPVTPVTDLACPWLGLSSYEERHASLFFGRDTERDELFRLVERGTLTVLLGVSGLGKTSLLNAGLFPKLRDESYLPIPIRLRFGADAPDALAQIREAIAREIAAHCADTPAPGEITLWEYFHSTPIWNHRANLLTPVLVLDQYEEVLALGHDDPRTRDLFEATADLVENYVPRSVRRRLEASQDGLPFSHEKPKIKVIVSLREDYFAQLQDLRPLIPSIMRTCYRLKAMSGTQAKAAVLGPAAKAGLVVTERVAERIVRIAAGEAWTREGVRPLEPALETLAVEPVLLSLFCDALNRTRIEQGGSEITEAIAQGERARILNDFYERCMAEVAPEVRRCIEDELLTKEGHRDTRAVENLPEVVRNALEGLIRLRLLRREERLGRPFVELIHDVLTEPILESRLRRREDERVAEVQRTEEERRKREVAEAEARVDEERRKREVAEAEARAEAARRRLRLVASAAVALFVLVGIAGGQWHEARKAREEVLVLKLAGDARVSAENNPDVAVLLAIESLRRRQTLWGTEAWSAAFDALETRKLRESLPEQPKPVPGGLPMSADGCDGSRSIGVSVIAAFSPAVERAATVECGEVVVWDLAEQREVRRLSSPGLVVALAFSPDLNWLAAAYADGVVRVWPLTGEPSPFELQHAVSVNAVAFDRDGRQLATAGEDGKVRIWDLVNPGTPLELAHEQAVQAVAFAPDGRELATASDTTVWLWPTSGGEPDLKLTLKRDQFVTYVAFSPDGRKVATGSADGTATLWSLKDGERLVGVQTPYAVKAVAFDPNGTHVATASADQVVRVWDTATGKERSRLRHSAPVQLVAFSRDGSTLVTVRSNELGLSPFRRWPWRTEDMIESGCERVGRNLTKFEWGAYFPSGIEAYRRTCPSLPEAE